MHTRDEFITKLKLIIQASPDCKHFKRDQAYSLGDGESYKLPNSVFILEDGRVLVTSTTNRKPYGIFSRHGFIGKGFNSVKVKRGRLYSADFLSSETVAVKKYYGWTGTEVEFEVKANQELYGLGEKITYQPRNLDAAEYLIIIMKYFPGGNLSDAFDNKPLSNDQRVELVVQALLALAYVHSKDICHDDIQAKNIRYNPETNQCAFIDFGSDSCKSTKEKLLSEASETVGKLLCDAFHLQYGDAEAANQKFKELNIHPTIQKIILAYINNDTSWFVSLAESIKQLQHVIGRQSEEKSLADTDYHGFDQLGIRFKR